MHAQRCRAYSPSAAGRPGNGAAPRPQLDSFAEQARGGAAGYEGPEDGGYEALREDAARSRQDFWGLDDAGDEDDDGDDDDDDIVEEEVQGLQAAVRVGCLCSAASRAILRNNEQQRCICCSQRH